jgi:SIR2-like domain
MSEIKFLQGSTNLLENITEERKKIEFIKSKISELFNMKNIYFLFGSGTSNGAIPVMKDLFSKVKENVNKLDKEIIIIFDNIKLKSETDFEELLGILYSQRIYLENQTTINEIELNNCKKLISEIEKTIFEEINIDIHSSKTVLDIYKKFYQKVSLRNRDLSRINIFTTNNDLFNETALDSINVNYINGFIGGLNKFFNPAFFNYSFSKRMDTSIDKYEPVENMVYLYKLHGSVNWIEDKSNKNSFFDISEIVSKNEIEYKEENNILIYPTPTKQDKSLGSPYTELFREFQKKLLEQHSVLFIIGYGFNDSHVNNIIHQALATNSSMNVVIFKELNDTIKLSKIEDSRVFKIWGEFDGKKINYFEYIVDHLIPDVNEYKASNDILTKFIDQIKDTN